MLSQNILQIIEKSIVYMLIVNQRNGQIRIIQYKR